MQLRDRAHDALIDPWATGVVDLTEPDDGLDAVRGIVLGTVLSIPLWGVIVAVAWLVLRR